ncbi:hypothetical protein [Desulfosarcina cetonica]|uniref:hypothetical protein n=1 Tax=Desulfosarcina cetonica TaxID=90730 RepID=UPI0006CF263E|nr:hypothetical protein [Desulfosarcina cetonica]
MVLEVSPVFCSNAFSAAPRFEKAVPRVLARSKSALSALLIVAPPVPRPNREELPHAEKPRRPEVLNPDDRLAPPQENPLEKREDPLREGIWKRLPPPKDRMPPPKPRAKPGLPDRATKISGTKRRMMALANFPGLTNMGDS